MSGHMTPAGLGRLERDELIRELASGLGIDLPRLDAAGEPILDDAERTEALQRLRLEPDDDNPVPWRR